MVGDADLIVLGPGAVEGGYFPLEGIFKTLSFVIRHRIMEYRSRCYLRMPMLSLRAVTVTPTQLARTSHSRV